ncbi:MAG TPA: TIGR00299 family protein, partial [Lentisphaeria bacterium]|nr:TIGR00299 family protein [Lentisphaeria bacterium]
PTAGIAGDMLAAALLDAGADTPEFHEQLARIEMPCESWQASVEETVRRGIRAKQFQVTVNGD